MTNETLTLIDSVVNTTAAGVAEVVPTAYVDVTAQVISIAGAICVVASIITASTKTPDPSTLLGKVYKVIELCALVVGRAKK